MQDFQPIPGLTGLIFPDSTPNPTRRFHAHHHSSSSSSSSSSPPIKCPRCDSTNTKFCYYNNYNFSQPRHFCKSCRRYWTKGGVLRNVPVGGGCRKNSSSSSSSSSKRSRPKPDKNPNPTPASASASGSSSESSSNPLPNPNPYPILEHPVFSHADFGFCFSDTGLLTEEQKVEGIGDGLEWGAGGSDSGSLFDMTGSLNPAVYWNQSHWGDTDPSLDLP